MGSLQAEMHSEGKTSEQLLHNVKDAFVRKETKKKKLDVTQIYSHTYVTPQNFACIRESPLEAWIHNYLRFYAVSLLWYPQKC